jgi:hypothetical protein
MPTSKVSDQLHGRISAEPQFVDQSITSVHHIAKHHWVVVSRFVCFESLDSTNPVEFDHCSDTSSSRAMRKLMSLR